MIVDVDGILASELQGDGRQLFRGRFHHFFARRRFAGEKHEIEAKVSEQLSADVGVAADDHVSRRVEVFGEETRHQIGRPRTFGGGLDDDHVTSCYGADERG